MAAQKERSYRDYPWPGHPHSPQYVRNHHALVRGSLADPELIARFRSGAPLPSGFGTGFDERVVEYPWLLAHAPFGYLLDAGSTLNHRHVLDAFQPQTDRMCIVTLAPETASFPARRISYVYADLRELPLREEAFDTVICASTIEHVGMDNTVYGGEARTANDVEREATRALRELRRVLSAAGRILATVPYGQATDMGWQRQFDRASLERLIESADAREATITVFAYSSNGWQLSDLEGAANARYHRCEPRDELPADRAVAARSVAAVELKY